MKKSADRSKRDDTTRQMVRVALFGQKKEDSSWREDAEEAVNLVFSEIDPKSFRIPAEVNAKLKGYN